MWWLQCAMGEVCGEFKTSLNIIRVVLCDTSSFKLNGDTEQIFTRGGDGVSPLFSNVSDEVKRKDSGR
jgi:Na+-transporting NADH:ubiquinone oxidoreductase subunit NqrF